MAAIEGTRARQSLFADHAPGVQHGVGGVPDLVPPGTAPRLHQSNGQGVASIVGGPRQAHPAIQRDSR